MTSVYKSSIYPLEYFSRSEVILCVLLSCCENETSADVKSDVVKFPFTDTFPVA